MSSEEDNVAAAIQGNEVQGLDIFAPTRDNEVSSDRVQQLMAAMHKDIPSGGVDLRYGDQEPQHLRFWASPSQSAQTPPPIIIYIHGGSWRVGTNLDSLGSHKVTHLLALGYAFASINFTLIPTVTLETQVQEIATAISYLSQQSAQLHFNNSQIVLMGHSSGAHVVSLLGTDTRYLSRAGVDISSIRGVIALDGSNFNAPAEFHDSPGSVANNLEFALGREIPRLREMSPTYNARGPNAAAFLLLHKQRAGDLRQAVEFAAVLEAVGTAVELRIFEGEGFEGHVQMLLRLGLSEYPATGVMDEWLRVHVPV